MPSRLKQACIAAVTAAACIAVLALSALPSHAQQGPFAGLSGAWSGGGNITLASGSRERIQCRATYNAQPGGNELQLALRCASDSYNFDFRGNAIASGGSLSGNWSEATQNQAGQFTGQVKGNHISVRIAGQTFAALLGVTTHGKQQTIRIQSPGSQISDVMIALKRR